MHSINLERNWCSIQKKEHLKDEIIVTSYNILAECNIQPFLFKGRDLSQLAIKKRYPLIIKELEELKSDIIFLQEVDMDFHISLISDLENWAKKNKKALIYRKKPYKSKPEGCVIIYDTTKFELKDWHFCNLTLHENINYFRVDNTSDLGI